MVLIVLTVADVLSYKRQKHGTMSVPHHRRIPISSTWWRREIVKSLLPEEVRFKRDRKDEYALTWQGEVVRTEQRKTRRIRALMGERTELGMERCTGADWQCGPLGRAVRSRAFEELTYNCGRILSTVGRVDWIEPRGNKARGPAGDTEWM